MNISKIKVAILSFLIVIPLGSFLFNVNAIGSNNDDEENAIFSTIDSQELMTSCCNGNSQLSLPSKIQKLSKIVSYIPYFLWQKPSSQKKHAMENKIDVLEELVLTSQYEEAYDKLLHDIKPKLTGFKTDENGQPWGNGNFSNPWIKCRLIRIGFNFLINNILAHIKSLIDEEPPLPTIEVTFSNIEALIDEHPAQYGDTNAYFSVNVNITGNADISSVNLNVNGLETQMDLVEGTDLYEININLDDGTHSYYFTAEDSLSNTYTSETSEMIIEDDDIDAPTIFLTPGSTTMADGDAIGGILFEWQITDYSGISGATAMLNGIEVTSYGTTASISDSYLQPNLPGTYTLNLTANDNDFDSENDWLGTSAQSTISIYDDYITAPSITIRHEGGISDNNPGEWRISITEPGVGIGGVQILIDGVEYLNDQEIGGINSLNYIVPVPKIVGLRTIEVNIKNNDNDWNGDQELSSQISTIEIEEYIPIPTIVPIGAATIGATLGIGFVGLASLSIVSYRRKANSSNSQMSSKLKKKRLKGPIK